MDCPTTDGRNNVRPVEAPRIQSFPLGAVWDRTALRYTLTKSMKERPRFTRLVTKVIRKEHPEFCFHSLHFNRAFSSRLHADSNNWGPSLIIGLGDYTGGRLWIYNEQGTDPFVVPENTKKVTGYPKIQYGVPITKLIINGIFLTVMSLML